MLSIVEYENKPDFSIEESAKKARESANQIETDKKSVKSDRNAASGPKKIP